MSKGVVIFAYNSKINYVDIATVAAKLVKKHLGLPVTLITNIIDVDRAVFDTVIYSELDGAAYDRVFKFSSSNERMPWHNQNRSSVYDLSPYDQTLLIDADYLIFNNELVKLFDTNLEFACYNRVYDITGSTELQRDARVGNPGIPMQWATVIYFTRNELAKSVFGFMQDIKKNYMYYAAAYNFTAHLFRNDYTLSIALQALTGYNTTHFTSIPGALISVDTSVDIHEVRPNGEIVFSWQRSETNLIKITKVKNTSIHIMNKKSITDATILNQLHGLTQ